MADGKEAKSEVGEQSKAKQVDPVAKEHWRKGNALFEESKFEDSVKEYTAALAIDASYADAYFNRALTERMINDFAAARSDLERVLELQPKSYDAPLLIGDMAENRNDLLGARYWYERALANNPEYTEAKTRLERIDSLIHMDSYQGGKGGTAVQQQQKGPMKADQQKDVVEEGQIKKVAFFKSEIRFRDVIGLKKVKKYLAENVVLAIKEPALFKRYGKKLGVGLLLYGPPGTGKTHIVKAIAGESGANVIIARVNQIVDMYTGNTEKNLHAIFEQARKNTPCIIFFDELDALGVKRGGDGADGGGNNTALRLAVNQFLIEMSGVETNPEGIYVIGATNTPWDIDPALKRSGRFGDSVYLKPPTYGDRKGLFKYYTRNKPVGSLNYGRLARATMGYSPADIERIADKAAMLPLLHEYVKHQTRKYTMKDVLSILRDKDYSGSSLDEWYAMTKKDVISKTETQIVNGKKQETVKEGKLDAQEKILYKAMVGDIKKNTKGFRITFRKFVRWWALHLF
jgi:AAA+ superfamily predicted ATPase